MTFFEKSKRLFAEDRSPYWLKVLAVLLLSLFFGALVTWLATAAETWQMPYHPYRKVGNRYYSLQPLYDYMRIRSKSSQAKPAPETLRRPLWEWVGIPVESGVATTYTVAQIISTNLLLIQPTSSLIYGTRGPHSGDPFVLTNYPYAQGLVDNQEIKFFALRTGSYTYLDGSSVSHTVALYDYGHPYNPQDLAATNSPPATP